MPRLAAFLMALPIALMMLSCGPKAAQLGEYGMSKPGQPTFTYVKVRELYMIQALSDMGLRAAMSEIGCDSQTCFVSARGQVWAVEVANRD